MTKTQLTSLANALLRAIADGLNPQVVWSTSLTRGTLAAIANSAGIPKTVANAVRIYQRILYTKE